MARLSNYLWSYTFRISGPAFWATNIEGCNSTFFPILNTSDVSETKAHTFGQPFPISLSFGDRVENCECSLSFLLLL